MKRPLVVFVSAMSAALLLLCFVFADGALILAAADFALLMIYISVRGSRHRRAALVLSLGFAFGCLVWAAFMRFAYTPVTAFAGEEGMISAVVCDYPQKGDELVRAVERRKTFNS